MTRRRTRDFDLPPRVYRHGAGFRFVPVDTETGRNGKPVPLGRDKTEAMRRWAALMGEAPAGPADTLAAIWGRYERDDLPRHRPATQAGYKQAIKPLLRVFGEMRAADIEPHHAIQYLDRRREMGAPIQGNREIQLLRAILTRATHWGILRTNPLLGLHYRNPEPPRERYVTDDELAHAVEHAPTAWMRALIWLAYLTGLRRRDLLGLTRFQLQDDGIAVRESKTGKRVLIEWTPELRRVVDAALADSPDARLFPVTESAVNNAWGRWQRSLAAEGRERFMLRDIRAKHATDFAAAGGDATAQLGHSARAVTIRHYLRAPRRVVPLR